MASSLNILDNFTFVSAMGQQITGAQGPIANQPSVAVNLATLSLLNVFGSPAWTGVGYADYGTLATATALKIYDSTVMKPATFNYFYLWADQPLYLQFITSATNFTTQVLPQVPFVMSVDGVLAAANTTAITGGSTPALVAVSTIYLGNYSGVTANWQVAVIL